MKELKLKQCDYLVGEVKEYKYCDFLTVSNAERAVRFVKSYPEYQKTPLINLQELAKKFNVKNILVKDESKRLGLNAFKGVGVLYGAVKVICEKFSLDINNLSFKDLLVGELNKKIKEMTFIAATDGNHGRGLAWVAQKLGCACHIYMPKNTTEARIRAIESLGAKVIVTEGNYDETLKIVIEEAKRNNWEHIQDQAWEGYTKITNFISEGYTIIADEIREQLLEYNIEKPTHIFLQAGAGTFALGIMGYFANLYRDKKPYMGILEPKNAACYYNSIKNGKYTEIKGDLETIMAGLSVGEANIVAWDILKTIVDGYGSCEDSIAARGMRILANPLKGDTRIVSGESGAIGLGFVSMVCQLAEFEKLKEELKIDESSQILLISTEGDTDPEMYQSILWDMKY